MKAPHPRRPDRRAVLRAALATGSALTLSGCEPLSEKPWVKNVLALANDLTLKAQRLLLGRDWLAPEYPESDISDQFRANGSTDPQDKDYVALAKAKFVNWRLIVDGLVDHPQKLSLDDLRAMPSRTQITRHDCVEGWSCIGKWKGVPLQAVLDLAGVQPAARYLVLYCFDTMDDDSNSDDNDDTDTANSDNKDDKGNANSDNKGNKGNANSDNKGNASSDNKDNANSDNKSKQKAWPRYYESIDLADAAHPQTILAYEMNGQTLTIPYGAPLRLRLEQQLGYKMAKYLMRIEAVESFAAIADGKGGYWEDRDYDWYAGI